VHVVLHERQQEIYDSPARFKVVAAGRRFGKSYLAGVLLFVEASKTTKTRSDGVTIGLGLEEVFYVAPTFDQGKRIMWPLLKELGLDLIAQKYENTGTLELINGRRISIKGSDRPDTLRGIGLSYVVLDEYAFMKEEVWEQIIMPALTRSEGGAMFIGTPDGKNHFYDLWMRGNSSEHPDWVSWHFPSVENPFLMRKEIEDAKSRMSTERFKQEMEASFDASQSAILLPSMFTVVRSAPEDGDYYIAADLAGFQKVEGGRKIKKLDEHAIAVVKVWQGGWCIEDIIHGQWDVRETALRLVKAYRDYRPIKFGIEKGMAHNAVMPYLDDEMSRLNCYFTVHPLSHGNQAKTDRIAWALQGRAEKGRVQLVEGDWNRQFLQQCADFPSPLGHDDLIDAVAYIDQISEPFIDHELSFDDWEPLDDVSGY
jgi:hypothetical protein